jgi:hypothetical protein
MEERPGYLNVHQFTACHPSNAYPSKGWEGRGGDDQQASLVPTLTQQAVGGMEGSLVPEKMTGQS